MNIYLREKIGNPALFTGRKRELSQLLTWVEKIKQEISPSRSLLSRRKTGKTALLQRLYNIVFDKNNGVIPFYYEIKETDQWSVDFCRDFFLTFVYQYLAFKTRNTEYLNYEKDTFERAWGAANAEGQRHLLMRIEGAAYSAEHEQLGTLWDTVRDAPRIVADTHDERVVQIIDEFQYLNRKIYYDKALTRPAHDFAQAYMTTAEYKNAPLLVSGSWVGWLMHDLLKMPARFQLGYLENMPSEETVEMVFRYSLIEDIPVIDETAYLIADLSEGNPFYISSLFRSQVPHKDFSTREGVLFVLQYETIDPRGGIHSTWMEYVHSAFSRINDRNAKNIVLYLNKHRDRWVGRQELTEKLKLELSETELEQKMDALVKADIIEQGTSYYFFKGVQDNIFDKVFRSRYEDEINAFDPAVITGEYKAMFDELIRKYRSLSGEYNYFKGKYAEFIIIRHLVHRAYRENKLFLSWVHNLPQDFQFTEYESVWSYKSAPLHQRDIQIDIFARAKPGAYSLISEIKNRQDEPFSQKEAVRLMQKAHILIELEKVEQSVLFVFCRCGLTAEAAAYCTENNIAWSSDLRWLEASENHAGDTSAST